MFPRRSWSAIAVGIVLLGLLSAPALAADGDLVWARQLGGGGADGGFGVAVDGSGNVYTTGQFQGTVDFDPGVGTVDLTSAGDNDIFVSKVDAVGDFVWARQLGGPDPDQGQAVAVDGSGNVYTTGSFQGTADFDPGGGVETLSSPGSYNMFLSKLDADGGFVWVRHLGAGASGGESQGVAVDGSGNIYTTGYFEGTADFDPGMGVLNLISAGSADVFVSKLQADGDFEWARRLGGTGLDVSAGVAVDGSGNLYISGLFEGTVDFDPGVEVSNMISAGSYDVFVSKLDADGDFVWARQLGGPDPDQGQAVAVDGSGNVYTTGSFQGTADFDPGVGVSSLVSAGSDDVFVSKLDAAGGFGWARRLGGTAAEYGYGVAVDGSRNLYTTGFFDGTADFDPGIGTVNLTSAGDNDIFVSKLDADGDFVWASPLGGPGADDQGYGVAASGGNVVATGYFDETADFDPGAGTVELTSAGSVDAFVWKLESLVADTVGLVNPSQGQWHLRNGAGAVTSFYFGNPGDYPFVGDWDCDGDATPGMYRQSDGFVYLRNSNTQGIADIRFFFGNPGDVPIAGDFDNDGCDTVSIYRPSEGRFFIINELGENDGGLGAAEFSYYFGNPGDKPFVGDFDGDGDDTVGLHRESTGLVYFRNTHTQGVADSQFIFGDPGDRLIAGDWGIVDGVDTPAVFRPTGTTFFFRHTNTQGVADSQFVWGSSTWLPVAGKFGLG